MGKQKSADGTMESGAGAATTASGSGPSPLVPDGAPPKGPTGRAVSKIRKARGNKLPSPKKRKKAREADAIKQVAKQGDGAAGGAGPLGGLGGAERVVDSAERAARWMQERWQLLVAVGLLALCATAFVSWRVRAAHRHEALAFHELDVLVGGEDAKTLARYESLLDRFSDTEAAPSIRLALARILLDEGSAASLERAGKIFREVKGTAAAGSVSAFAAEQGLRLLEARKGFDPQKVDLESAKPAVVPDLAPLPAAASAPEKAAPEKAAPEKAAPAPAGGSTATPAPSSGAAPASAPAQPAPKAPTPVPAAGSGSAPSSGAPAPPAPKAPAPGGSGG